MFLDVNDNGLLDVGELQTSTDADGVFNFTDLGPGSYRVRLQGQPGWTQTTGNPSDLPAVSASDITDIVFGAFANNTILGQVFEDTDGNGILDDGEIGLADWTVFLDANDNGVLDDGELSSVTDSLGNYAFGDLAPAIYRVRMVPQTGWVQSSAHAEDLTASSGNAFADVNLGAFRPISISGRVFQDDDNDGAQGQTELGLAGWTIFLDSDGNDTFDEGELSTVTDADGNFTFTNLGPGTYRVRILLPDGWLLTTSELGDIVATSGVDVLEQFFGVTFAEVP
jgi:protocatechuate 3,4-dioxygenase beta subunit